MDYKRIASLLRRKWRVLTLLSLTLALVFSFSTPIKTVKGIITNTGFTVVDATISIYAGRIVFKSGPTTVTVYDTVSGSSTSFATPACIGGATDCTYQPVIFGQKIVLTWFPPSLVNPTTIYYCDLPRGALQPCGPWEVIDNQAPGFSYFAAWGFPVAYGDLVAWFTIGGLKWWRFSSELAQSITTDQPTGVSTNGEIIAFNAKPLGSPSYVLRFFDTSDPAQGVVSTGRSSGVYGTSISDHTMAFQDNSTSPNRIGYYDVMRSTYVVGTGPVGTLSYFATPAISGDRILFRVAESASGFNFDCNGNGQISGSEYCLRYWNIRPTNFVAALLVPSAAPTLTLYPAIPWEYHRFHWHRRSTPLHEGPNGWRRQPRRKD